MAETKTVKAVETAETPKKPEMETIILDIIPDPKASQQEFYSFNFKNCLIKRGVPVVVPKELADLIRAQKQAEADAMDYIVKNGVREAQ